MKAGYSPKEESSVRGNPHKCRRPMGPQAQLWLGNDRAFSGITPLLARSDVLVGSPGGPSQTGSPLVVWPISCAIARIDS